jgi:hypothetical protein
MRLLNGLLILAAGLVAFTSAGAMIREGKIEDIMEKGFKKGGLRHQISTEIDKDAPNWSDVEKKAKDLQKMCDELCKEKQPQGEEVSWKKLTEDLQKQTKSLADAANKKDLATAKSYISKINNSCKECHDAHRP